MAHGSIDRESNPPGSSLAQFGISDVGRTDAPRVPRDSVDLIIDPRLAATTTPAHRITAIPTIVIPRLPVEIPRVSRETAVVAPRRLEVPTAPELVIARKPIRSSRGSRMVAWAVAAIASISIGTVAGRVTRAQSPAHPIAAMRFAVNAHAPGLQVVQAGESQPAVRAPLASPNATPVATTIDDESPQPERDQAGAEVRAHSSSHSSSRSNNALLAVAEPAAEVAPMHVEAPVAAQEPTAPVERQSAAASNRSCASRCGDDLACAAACVVHGGQAEPAHPTATPAPIAEPEATPAPAAALADGPTREDVVRAIHGVLPAVRDCGADDENSVAHVTITFAASGRVTTANTEAPYAGTPSGSCIARAVRAATVPPFARASFTVRAPFAMR